MQVRGRLFYVHNNKQKIACLLWLYRWPKQLVFSYSLVLNNWSSWYLRTNNQPFLIYHVYTFISSKLFFFVLFSGDGWEGGWGAAGVKGHLMNNFIMAVYHLYNALNIFPWSVCILLYDEKCTHDWCWHKTMRHRLRQNATNVSEIYIGRPICISDFQYIYRTSNIYIRHPISISDIRCPCPSPCPSWSRVLYIGRRI